MKYAYYTSVVASLTLDKASQFIGGLYSDHMACQPEDANHIWNIFQSDFDKNIATFGSLYEASKDRLDAHGGYRYKVLIYETPRSGSVREKLILFAGIQAKTYTPQIPGTEFGYARIYRLQCKYNLLHFPPFFYLFTE